MSKTMSVAAGETEHCSPDSQSRAGTTPPPFPQRCDCCCRCPSNGYRANEIRQQPQGNETDYRHVSSKKEVLSTPSTSPFYALSGVCNADSNGRLPRGIYLDDVRDRNNNHSNNADYRGSSSNRNDYLRSNYARHSYSRNGDSQYAGHYCNDNQSRDADVKSRDLVGLDEFKNSIKTIEARFGAASSGATSVKTEPCQGAKFVRQSSNGSDVNRSADSLPTPGRRLLNDGHDTSVRGSVGAVKRAVSEVHGVDRDSGQDEPMDLSVGRSKRETDAETGIHVHQSSNISSIEGTGKLNEK